jgi:hypothetical protein
MSNPKMQITTHEKVRRFMTIAKRVLGLVLLVLKILKVLLDFWK